MDDFDQLLPRVVSLSMAQLTVLACGPASLKGLGALEPKLNAGHEVSTTLYTETIRNLESTTFSSIFICLCAKSFSNPPINVKIHL